MKVFGIVAEYNPFHNGHKYQIEYIKKELGADAVIAVMSGDFVQRGEPTLLDKYSRAKMAINGGVDLVLQIPVTASTASAEMFARCGISLLLSTGIVTDIAFGCEREDADLFYAVAKIFDAEPPAFRDALQRELKAGASFSEARATALKEVWADYGASASDFSGVSSASIDDITDFVSQPNNILGIEYTRALLHFHSNAAIHPILRKGTSHDAASYFGEYASASYLRKRLKNTDSSIDDFVPEAVAATLLECAGDGRLVFANDISLLLHDRLISSDEYSDVMDCSKELSHRIQNLRDSYVDFQQFSDLLHTKNLELSRIRRVLLHLLLSITDEHLLALKDCGYAPYLRILSFSENGASLLKTIKQRTTLPIFASVNEARHLIDPPARDAEPLVNAQSLLLQKDVFSANIYRILQTEKSRRTQPTEFTKKFNH